MEDSGRFHVQSGSKHVASYNRKPRKSLIKIVRAPLPDPVNSHTNETAAHSRYGGTGTSGSRRLQLICAKGMRTVVSFSRLAGGNFQETSLLAEPRTLSAFDAVLHLGWSTLPLTSEEEPGSGAGDRPAPLERHFGCLRSRPAPAASGFLFVGGSLRKHDCFRHRRNALPPPWEICARQADGGRGHSHSVHAIIAACGAASCGSQMSLVRPPVRQDRKESFLAFAARSMTKR